MVGLSRAARLEKTVKDADLKIKERLPDLIEVLINAAISSKRTTTCPKCSAVIPAGKGDPNTALKLVERVMGKPDVAKPVTAEDALTELLTKLAEGRKTPAAPVALTEEDARLALRLASGAEEVEDAD